MSQHLDILDQRDPMSRSFAAALGLHAALAGGILVSTWLAGERETFGAPDAGGGAIGIEAVNAIPLAHTGMQNPVANDTESQVPQQPKPRETERKEKISPNAVPLKTREKRRMSD